VPTLGALSNPRVKKRLSRAAKLRKKLLREAAASPGSAKDPPVRHGAIQEAVAKVLSEAAPEAMHAAQIHLAVERLLGIAMPSDSIFCCLSRGASSPEARFERLGRGRYRWRRSWLA
jgi:hypothetical protein